MSNTYAEISKKIHSHASSRKRDVLQRFFKTGPGEYGEGDIFIGVSLPVLRKIVHEYRPVHHAVIETCMRSPIHEERMFGTLALVDHYTREGNLVRKRACVRLYLSLRTRVNNWDLVDVSAPYILGDFARASKYGLNTIQKLSRSKKLWEKRIAIVSTFAFLRNGDDAHTYTIASRLMNDSHDLIHKAVGWMLREAGKRVSVDSEKKFLLHHAEHMPRTMLRYAIEHFSKEEKKFFLQIKKKK